jgi:hypothetical protein
MGKKPVISLAGLLLAGVAITATGCGQCTSCNTRPGKFNPGPISKSPTPAVGDKKTKTEVAADGSIPPAPAPIEPVSGPALPPPGTTTGALKKDMPPVTTVSMEDGVPGREPLEGAGAPSRTSSSTSFPVPPTPVRSTLGGASRSIPASPVTRAPDLPTDTTTPPLPQGVVPLDSPPAPTPPVATTPPPPGTMPGTTPPPGTMPLPGATPLPGTTLPPLQN